MKKLILVLPIILLCALLVEAAGPKTMTRTIQAGDIDTLDLSSGIGDVTITAREARGGEGFSHPSGRLSEMSRQHR
jgi:hypothetical protein